MNDNAKNTRNLFIGLILCGVLLIAIVGVLQFRSQMNAAPPSPMPTATFEPDTPGVTPIEPPRALQNFTLPGSTGDPLSLSDFQGKYTLLFFGYTNCPDICPLTLAEWTQVKAGLGEDADEVYFLFISVDGERDTPEALADYLSRFDAGFLGMSGDAETLEAIGADYGLYYELMTDEGANYAVDHSTPSYLIDPEGRLVALFSYGADVDVIIEAIKAEMAAA